MFVALLLLGPQPGISAPSPMQIAAGGSHSCAVTSAGAAECWGLNADGELGDGTTTERHVPVPVSGLGSGVAGIAAGDAYSCAVTTGGGVECWGFNFSGQLGDGTTMSRSSPVGVSGLASGVVSVAAGYSHTCALTNGGGVKCWGDNAHGELGDGTTTESHVPVDASGLASHVAQIGTGDAFTCVLTTGGAVECFGFNFFGELGNGATTDSSTPVGVSGLGSSVRAIAVGYNHACALTAAGGVECWGSNFAGQLGDGTTNDSSTPVAVSGLANVTAIAAGADQTCAVTASGDVDCWGSNDFGQLGDAHACLTPCATPVSVFGVADASALAAGDGHSCALTSSGVRCWGMDDHGQLGTGTTIDFPTPQYVTGLSSPPPPIAVGNDHACAVTAAGGIRCWGSNVNGQLGDGTTTTRTTPVDVVGLANVTAISTGGRDSCALTAVGGVKCWGDNSSGQLGDNSTTDSSTPVDVVGLTSGVAAIAVSGGHTCALTVGGGVKCWGLNNAGQLGDGTTTDRHTPVDVSSLTSGVAAIAAGDEHTCAVTTAGGIDCWGLNGNGQVGDGTTTDRHAPVSVALSGVAAVDAGAVHTCALLGSGAAKCWGFNNFGALGDGTFTQRTTPVDVSGLASGAAGVGVGAFHSCALLATSGVDCWGYNFYGQIGDGTTTNRTTPTQALVAGAAVVAAGGNDTCVRTTAGGIRCWGYNGEGELGNGTTADSSTPVEVRGFEDPRSLTVAKAGSGAGAVASNPAGIGCGATCSQSFAFGSSVTLTATAASGSVFAGWSGGGCSGTATCTVTLNADTTVTATFLVLRSLSVHKAGTGSGTVTSVPAGIDCGVTCAAALADGASVTLQASAATGSTFAGWSGDCSGTKTSCVLAMSANRSATARFTTVSTLTATPKRCVVPKLIGAKLATAKARLRKAHCRLGKVKRRFSVTKTRGRVVAQSAKARKKLKTGAKVNVTVGKGPRKR